MTTHGGRTARTLRAVSGAALAALLTVLMLSVHATAAAASTDHTVTLGLSNVRVDIDAGDSVTYDVIGGAYQVLGGVAGSTVRYTDAGTYTVSWSVQKVISVLGPLGKAVSRDHPDRHLHGDDRGRAGREHGDLRGVEGRDEGDQGSQQGRADRARPSLGASGGAEPVA